MSIDETVREVAKAVSEIKYLAGVPVIVEEKGDTSAELQANIGKTSKVAVLVGWNGADPVKQSAEIIIANFNIVVSLFERPVINRKGGSGGPTICKMAQTVAKALTYAQAEGMECPLFLKRITPISELGAEYAGTVTCDVVFNTKAEL